MAFIILYSSYQFGLLFPLIMYNAAWHFTRQQYGWMRISARKAEENDFWIAQTDKIFLYSVTIIPILIGHSETKLRPWFAGNRNLFSISNEVASALLYFYFAVVVTYLLLQLICTLRGRQINFAKLLILFSTAYCWYEGFLRDQRIPYLFLIALVGGHAVSYYFIVQKDYFSRRPTQARNFFIMMGSLALIAYFVAIFKANLLQRNDIFMTFIPRLDPQFFLGFDAGFLLALFYTPTLGHYFNDAFIWKQAIPNDDKAPGASETLIHPLNNFPQQN